MKKKIYPFLLLLILSSLVGCNSKSNQNDLQKMNLKGEVIGIKKGNGFTFFDSHGNLEKSYEDEATIKDYTEYFYINDKLEKSIQRISPHEFSTTLGREKITIYKYNENGTLKSTSMIKDGKLDEEERFIYETNNHNLLTKLTTIKEYPSTKLSSKTINIYEYDNDNSLKKEIIDLTFTDKNNSSIYKWENFYKNGYIYTSIEKGEIVKFDYFFDSKGNWIQEKNLKTGEIESRIIFYKGENISQYENKYNDVVSLVNNL